MVYSEGSSWRRKLGITALWILTVIEMLGMGLAGFSKFGSPDTWQAMFIDWGYAGWFAYVVGLGEMVAAIALLVPRLAQAGAAAIIVIMLGALFTELTRESGLGPTAPMVHIGLATVILFSRRHLSRAA